MLTTQEGVGFTVTAAGGGYSAVCLACPRPMLLRIRVRLRSMAVHALNLHHRATHG